MKYINGSLDGYKINSEMNKELSGRSQNSYPFWRYMLSYQKEEGDNKVLLKTAIPEDLQKLYTNSKPIKPCASGKYFGDKNELISFRFSMKSVMKKLKYVYDKTKIMSRLEYLTDGYLYKYLNSNGQYLGNLYPGGYRYMPD